jgi:hypothetical protein
MAQNPFANIPNPFVGQERHERNPERIAFRYRRLLGQLRDYVEDLLEVFQQLLRVVARAARQPQIDLMQAQRLWEEIQQLERTIIDAINQPLVQQYSGFTITVVVSRNLDYPVVNRRMP